MKAIRLYEYGGPENLTFDEISRPVVKDGKILVKIYAVSVNHFDIKVASGMMKDSLHLTLPWIPGTDFAGKIEAIGNGVNGFKKGDEIYGLQLGDLYADYALVDPKGVALKPRKLNFNQAAAIPQVATTAWQGLFTHGKLEKGQTVLIHGAAGGVGAYAVQFAHQKGAKVITTALEKDRSFLLSLGADEVIDYQNRRFEDEVSDVDVVFDLVGQDYQKRSFPILKKGGVYISVNQPIDEDLMKKYQIDATFMSMKRNGEDLRHIAGLLDNGDIQFDLGKVYPLKETDKAWNDFLGKGSQRTHGKIVLEVNKVKSEK